MGHIDGAYAASFERWVDERPDRLAVIGDDGRTFTYGEVEVAANRIANAVDDLDPEGRFGTVAIGLPQGTDAIIAIVAAAKTGRTQVPLDPGDPPARIAEVLGPLPPAVVLLHAAHDAAFAQVPGGQRLLLHIEDLPAAAPAERRRRTMEAEQPSLVIFTSGTTGRPRAGTRSHRAIVEITSRETEQWDRPGVRFAAVADHQWLAGWQGIRRALCCGGTIVRYDARRRGPAELARFLAEHEVQVLTAVPSLVRAMLDADTVTPLPSLRHVALAGDVVHRDLVVALFERLGPEARVQTGYGASELGGVAKLTMTRDTVPAGDIVPVGIPYERAEVEVEEPDEQGVGRLVIVSRRGAPAYPGADDADDSVTATGDGRWRHRTTDLGRIRPDGMLEVRGRLPHLVKVRGQRVGVTEVEGALLALPSVLDAGVGVHPADPTERLTAWVVPAPGATVHAGEIRRALRPRLPAFMLPATVVTLPELPRGTRGKLRRDELPAPGTGRPELGYPYAPPQGPVESAVAAAFATVLHVDRVGRHDALFDLGGDSLHAAEVMAMIGAQLGRDLPLSVFVEAATPAEIAARLDGAVEPAGRLVDLQPSGVRRPVYCIHGGGGQVLSLAGLAERMGPTRPFVGVQMLQGDRPRALLRVNQLADRYAGAIAARQGPEPCVVAGHSYGGVVAQEVSRRLVERGTPVELCVLLDIGVPRRRLLAGRRRRRRALGEIDTTSTVKELLYLVHAALALRPRPHRLTTERMIAAMWGMSWHRTRSTPVPLLAIRASGDPADHDHAAWARHTAAALEVADVPGGHNTMLASPYVDELATVLGQRLDELETAPAR